MDEIERMANQCDRCNVSLAYMRMLLEEVAEKERTSVTLGEKQRRTDVNLQLCRAELYSDKKSALKTVKKLERRLLSMQGMIAHLVEENKRKQAIIEELECAFTLQHELPQGGVHHRIQEEHLACADATP